MKWLAAAALLAAASVVGAQSAPAPAVPAPEVDAKAHPALFRMLATLRNGSESSRYCAQTGGMFLEADALLRENKAEKDVVKILVGRGQGRMNKAELDRLQQLAAGVTQMAAGFQMLAAESAAVAYTQTCLASTRSAPGTRDQVQLNERFRDALECDKRFKPGSLEGKECVARTFQYR